MSKLHEMFKFSITIHSDDLAVVNCLRALSKYSQKGVNNTIPYGNTKERDWLKANNCVTFRFSSPNYRDGFINESNRLLPKDLWSEVSRSDADQAKPAT
jgi:hypothetical protein